jgi:hypothetical protein
VPGAVVNAARFLSESSWSSCDGQSESWIATFDEGAYIRSLSYDHENYMSRSHNSWGRPYLCSRSETLLPAPPPPPVLAPVHDPTRFVGGWKP